MVLTEIMDRQMCLSNICIQLREMEINLVCFNACLAKIINLSFTTGLVPNMLKIAKVCPIYKYGDKTDINNYRPISVLPSFLKLCE